MIQIFHDETILLRNIIFCVNVCVGYVTDIRVKTPLISYSVDSLDFHKKREKNKIIIIIRVRGHVCSIWDLDRRSLR